SQPAGGHPRHREPVADDLSVGRVSGQQDASLLPLRARSPGSGESPHNLAHRPGIQRATRSGAYRVTSHTERRMSVRNGCVWRKAAGLVLATTALTVTATSPAAQETEKFRDTKLSFEERA